MPDNKTAMQELIELLDREIENNITRDAPVMTQQNQQPYKRIKSKALKLLEKEKIQITDAYMSGYGEGRYFEKQKIIRTDEEYYNATFKP